MMAETHDLTHLTSSQRNSLEVFQEVTQMEDIGVCLDIMNQNGWDVDHAIESFIQNRGTGSSNNPNRNDNLYSNDNARRSQQQTPISPNVDANNNPNNNHSIMDYVMNPIKWLFQTHPVSLNPERDARNFISDFESKFGSNHPAFIESSYNTAVSQAFRGPKFLLIYLHSPLHDDTNRFCR